MAFFQNLFDQEYQGYLVLGDRRQSLTFKVSPNKNLQSQQVAWNEGPYDFSSSGILEFNFAWDKDFKQWASVSIDVTGATATSTSASEVVSALNSDAMFSSVLLASVVDVNGGKSVSVSRKTAKNVKFYFSNTGAETKLKFNKKAGVAELPSYFQRHTVENINNFEDSAGVLLELDPSDVVDQAIIQDAGFSLTPKEDYELLEGRSGLFIFKKLTVDGSNRITQIIEYQAGASAGDLAKKTNFTYSGANTNPSKVTEIPYVLTNSDLVTP